MAAHSFKDQAQNDYMIIYMYYVPAYVLRQLFVVIFAEGLGSRGSAPTCLSPGVPTKNIILLQYHVK